MNGVKWLDAWHKTKIGLLAFAVLELLITYGFASLAIDRGNAWWYLLTLIFFVGFLQNLTRLVASFFKHHRPPKPRKQVSRG